MTTIGRVDFLVGLDGNNLPKQARRLADQISAAGTKAGKGFTDNFDKSFSDRLDGLANDFSKRLSKEGTLAGERFSSTFQRSIKGNFSGIQNELADALSSEDNFRKFAEGFDSSKEASDRLKDSIAQLRKEHVEVEEEVQRGEKTYTRMVKRLVLTENEAKKLTATLDQHASTLARDQAETKRLADETVRLEESWKRLGRLVGDNDAFGQYSDKVGGTERAFRKLRRQVEELGPAMGKTDGAIQEVVDRLERTRVSVDKSRISVGGFKKETKETESAIRKLGRIVSKPWMALDNDVRLVIGLIASAADQIAVLGSAAGAAGAVIGAGLTQGIVGLVGGVSIFATLNSEVEELPEHLRDAATEFQGMGTAFSRMAKVITSGSLNEIEGSFDSLSDTISSLDPEFLRLGDSIGKVTKNLAKGVEPGTRAYEELQELLDNTSDMLPGLAGSFGKLFVGLLNTLNGAQPLLEDFSEYIGRIGTQLDNFASGPGLDEWIGNAQTTFGALSGLLDAVGRALNDLVTPESVARTADLLDGLAQFVPILGDILYVIGTLDPIGLIVDLLVTFAEVIDPLLPLLEGLATGLNLVLSALIPLAPAALGVVAAFSLLNSGKILGGLSTIALKGMYAVDGLRASLIKTKGSITALTTGTAGLATKFGALGIAVGVAAGAGIGIAALSRELLGVDEAAKEAVATQLKLADAVKALNPDYEYLGKTLQNTTVDTDNLRHALDTMEKQNQNGGWFWSGWTIGAQEFGEQANELRGALRNLDKPMAELAATNLEAAQEQFRGWAEQANASTTQAQEMLNEMPQLKEALEEVSRSSGGLASEQELLALALGPTRTEMAAAEYNARETARALGEMEGKSYDSGEAIDGLADKIRNFGTETLDAREAERRFEEAIDDVTKSIDDNGTSLNTNTAEGRANESALDALARASLESAAATYEQTGKVEDATTAIEDGRDALIKQLKQFGLTDQAAEDYADELGLIPDNIDTIIDLNDKEATADARAVKAAVNDIPSSKIVNIDVNYRYSGATGPAAVGQGPAFGASGALVNGPEHWVIGEAGPEAVVPLRRPLSQVDPAVRGLSAIAQGLASPDIPHMASGGIGGAGRVVNIATGAIQVNETGNARRTAYDVLDVLANRVSG